jgi:hypothetical protein
MTFMPGFSNGYTSIAWSGSLNAPGREPFTIRPLSPAMARITEAPAQQADNAVSVETATGLIVRVRT